jgi:hypothetical protein
LFPDLPGWASLPAVTRYHNWAEVAGIVVLALLVIAEVVSFQYGRRKDDLTDKQQIATNQRHDEEMARLHLETAKANERTEELRAENLRLERQLNPRLITDEQAAEIIEKIKPFAGTPYEIIADPAAEYGFVDKLMTLLNKAQWRWKSFSVQPITLPPAGRIRL